jgi:hypothetical protein
MRGAVPLMPARRSTTGASSRSVTSMAALASPLRAASTSAKMRGAVPLMPARRSTTGASTLVACQRERKRATVSERREARKRSKKLQYCKRSPKSRYCTL